MEEGNDEIGEKGQFHKFVVSIFFDQRMEFCHSWCLVFFQLVEFEVWKLCWVWLRFCDSGSMPISRHRNVAKLLFIHMFLGCRHRVRATPEMNWIPNNSMSRSRAWQTKDYWWKRTLLSSANMRAMKIGWSEGYCVFPFFFLRMTLTFQWDARSNSSFFLWDCELVNFYFAALVCHAIMHGWPSTTTASAAAKPWIWFRV